MHGPTSLQAVVLSMQGAEQSCRESHAKLASLFQPKNFDNTLPGGLLLRERKGAG